MSDAEAHALAKRFFDEDHPPLDTSSPAGRYQIDRWIVEPRLAHLELSTIRRSINAAAFAGATSLHHGHLDYAKLRERAVMGYRSVGRLVSLAEEIRSLNSDLMAHGGIMWAHVSELREREATRLAVERLKREVSRTAKTAADYLVKHPIRTLSKGNNVDWLSRGVLRSLSGFWSEWTGASPQPKARGGKFIQFVADAWQDLGIPTPKGQPAKHDHLYDYLGEKWVGLNKSGG